MVAEAEAEGFVGLFMQRDPVRVYPYGDVAANIVGFLGTPKPRRIGPGPRRARGLVRRLPLRCGRRGPLRDGRGRPDPARRQHGQPRRSTAPTSTSPSTATCSSSRSGSCSRRSRRSRAESGIAVIMDSRTGEILALADYPTYDASEPQEWPKSRYKSSALTDVYEPGSTEKVLTLSCGHRRRSRQAATAVRRTRRPQPAGPADPRPLGARHRAPHPGRHPRQVVEHRHRARRRRVRARGSCGPT